MIFCIIQYAIYTHPKIKTYGIDNIKIIGLKRNNLKNVITVKDVTTSNIAIKDDHATQLHNHIYNCLKDNIEDIIVDFTGIDRFNKNFIFTSIATLYTNHNQLQWPLLDDIVIRGFSSSDRVNFKRLIENRKKEIYTSTK